MITDYVLVFVLNINSYTTVLLKMIFEYRVFLSYTCKCYLHYWRISEINASFSLEVDEKLMHVSINITVNIYHLGED